MSDAAAPSPAPAGSRPLVATLRPAALQDGTVGRVARVLADAFAEDHYMNSFLPAGRRAERRADLFDFTLRGALTPGPDGGPTSVVDVAVDPVDGRLLGAAIWDRPEAPRGHTVPQALAALPRMWRAAGRRAMALARTQAECERARPLQDHWYLRDLGTVPAARGRGVARLLVDRRRRDARAAGVGVYLESSSRANVPFYEHLGFVEGARVRAHGTEDLTGMWWQA